MAESSKQNEKLQSELERVTRELDQAISEKIQSAKCGLMLLKEKSVFQEKCIKLETLYENTKIELEMTKTAMTKLQLSQKITKENGIRQEDALLNESAAMESSFTYQIMELENEIKQLRQELERVTTERDNAIQENYKISREKLKFEVENIQRKNELKECKAIEKTLLRKSDDLEGENEQLRKKILDYKSEIEYFKKTQKEIKLLLDENMLLKKNIEDLTNIKQITEIHLNDALEALEIEREDKTLLKKELDLYTDKNCLYKTKTLAESILEVKGIDDSDLNQTQIILESEIEDINGVRFSFLRHFHDELKKLTERLDEFENEMKLVQVDDRTQIEIERLKSALLILTKNIDELVQLEDNEDYKKTYQDFDNAFKSELAAMQDDFNHSISEFLQKMHTNITSLKSKISNFDVNLNDCNNYLIDAVVYLKDAKNVIIDLNNQVSKFFNLNNDKTNCKDDNDMEFLTLVQDDDFQTQYSDKLELLSCSAYVKKYAEVVHTKIGYLKTTFEYLFSKKISSESDSIVKLLKQNQNLKNLLRAKQKQVVKLQTNLKVNKEIAENTLKNIRKKFDEEKFGVKETIIDLVNKIKILKEDKNALFGLHVIANKRSEESLKNAIELKKQLHFEKQETELFKNIIKTAAKKNLELQNSLQRRKKKVRFVLS